jgi:phosphoglycolate phosphatase-like HAD superfamily hydrolase
MEILTSIKGNKYVASGSEQTELRCIFKERNIKHHFKGIFGSPTSKTELIRNILEKEKTHNAVMIGDAESDFESARENGIDFIFYAPYSNVREKMFNICKNNNCPIIDFEI